MTFDSTTLTRLYDMQHLTTEEEKNIGDFLIDSDFFIEEKIAIPINQICNSHKQFKIICDIFNDSSCCYTKNFYFYYPYYKLQFQFNDTTLSYNSNLYLIANNKSGIFTLKALLIMYCLQIYPELTTSNIENISLEFVNFYYKKLVTFCISIDGNIRLKYEGPLNLILDKLHLTKVEPKKCKKSNKFKKLLKLMLLQQMMKKK